MTEFAANFSLLASVGVILSQLFIVFVIILLLVKSFGSASSFFSAKQSLAALASRGLLLGFLTAVTATIASLVYSNVIGFTPCELCWIQRIFLYPQVIILGLALWKKTRDAEIYCIFLSVIGATVAGYHYYGQTFNPNVLPACAAAGGASCVFQYFVEFGYITLPIMSFTAFLVITAVLYVARRT